MPENFESANATDLADYLCRFYNEGRCYDTRPFSKSTLSMIPQAINKHLRECGSKINVRTNPEFISANQMYHTVNQKKKTVKKQRKKEITVNTPVSQQDWAKLALSPALSLNTPKTLQFKIMVDFFQYFGVKGKFALQELQKEHFVLKKTPEGNEYFEFMDPDKEEEYPTMNSEPWNIHCPVYGFKKYLSHLDPECPVFLTYPRDRKGHHSETRPDHVWYTDRPLGLVYLADMMKNLSKEAGLSRLYTNKSFAIRTAPDAETAEDVTGGETNLNVSRLSSTETNDIQLQDELLMDHEAAAAVENIPMPESAEVDMSGNLDRVSSVSSPASGMVSDSGSPRAIVRRNPELLPNSAVCENSSHVQSPSFDTSVGQSDIGQQTKPTAIKPVPKNVEGQHNTQTKGSSAKRKRIVTPQAVQMDKQVVHEALQLQKQILASPPIQMKKPLTTPQTVQKENQSVAPQTVQENKVDGIPQQPVQHQPEETGSPKVPQGVIKVYPGMSHDEIWSSVRALRKQPSSSNQVRQAPSPPSKLQKRLKLPMGTIVRPSPKPVYNAPQPSNQRVPLASNPVQPSDDVKVVVISNPQISDPRLHGPFSPPIATILGPSEKASHEVQQTLPDTVPEGNKQNSLVTTAIVHQPPKETNEGQKVPETSASEPRKFVSTKQKSENPPPPSISVSNAVHRGPSAADTVETDSLKPVIVPPVSLSSKMVPKVILTRISVPTRSMMQTLVTQSMAAEPSKPACATESNNKPRMKTSPKTDPETDAKTELTTKA